VNGKELNDVFTNKPYRTQICPRTKDEGSGVKPLGNADDYLTHLVNVRGAAYLSHRP
jgi:hypothetical protein